MWLRDAPMPGYFAVRLGSRMPWTPAIIYAPCPWVEPDPWGEYDLDSRPEDWCTPLDRSPGPLRARIGERDTEDEHTILALWQAGNLITVAEYRFLMERRRWARQYEPGSYHAQRSNLRTLEMRELI